MADMKLRKEPRGSLVMPDAYRRIMRFTDEAFDDYLTGLVALRKRVVADLKRKLNRPRVARASRPRPSGAARERPQR
jgi:hypothetical protein